MLKTESSLAEQPRPRQQHRGNTPDKKIKVQGSYFRDTIVCACVYVSGGGGNRLNEG